MQSIILHNLDKLKASLKNIGFINTLLYLLTRILHIIFKNKILIHKYLIYAQQVPDKIKRRRTVFNFETIENFSPIATQFPRPFKTTLFRFNQKGVCIIATRDNEFVGYIWLNKDTYAEDVVRCKFLLYPIGKNSWDYDVYIEPKYRISTAFKRLWEEAFEYLKKNNIHYSISRIDAFNTNSIKVHEQLGAIPIGSILFFIVGDIQVMFSSFKPYVGLTIFKKEIIKIRINTIRLNKRRIS